MALSLKDQETDSLARCRDRATGEPLPFEGDDFAQTDIERAI